IGFFFSSRRRHTRLSRDWSSDVCSSDLFCSPLYRNKGAYLIGRIYTPEEQWPLAIPFVHREGEGIRIDALITDEADVSIIFSFRSDERRVGKEWRSRGSAARSCEHDVSL